jgi:poly(A) polymerase
MASDAEREDLVQAAKAEQQAKPRVRRAPRPEGEGAAPRAAKAVPEAMSEETAAEGDAPKKRRRRRRKPGGGEGSGSVE